ncbi:hypothetical protein Y88_0791 [Novosphingobium nitrogenifigens DSM 19370]|uniref:PpiC domain-containing protein n=1 Tax=Novosphingobium nitrogenifigens DSM 19370 TaxID=983920 RepID=F1Z9K9_9SPHN|nr:peptidylprolyl isomerase [Novosphingobium nitrogenifigens]EGD58733.1 hypothetical protein Y88_0791 [Novosphingobium nitrogenifigens DSM 19370]
MLGFFRAIIKSRFGAVLGLVFLVLIVLAFAGADVSGLRTGNLFGGDDVATVGHTGISSRELDKTVRAAFDGERQRTPTLTMKDFVTSQNALEEVLSGLIDRAAVQEWGQKNGIGVSDRLIDSEIAKLPAFQGPDGKFSQQVYNQLIAQRGLTDKQVREDIAKGLMGKLIMAGASEGAAMPNGVAQRYAELLKEKRSGGILMLPSQAFAPKAPATDQQVADFYKANIVRYQRPERRTIRYVLVDEAAIKNLGAPSDADIQKRYQANAALYAPNETRSITQVILPSQSAAQAFAADLAGGKTIEAAAAAKGLAPAKIADRTHDQLVSDTSKAVADAVFSAQQGKLITPTKGALGWSVARVDAIKKNPGKTLDQARAEIVLALTAERHKAAMTDLAARIGEQAENGTSLTDIVKAYGLTIQTTDPVQADGSNPAKPGDKLSPDVQGLVQAAFAMEHEGQPQVAGLPNGLRFAVFDVGAITPAAPAALAEIKAQVAADWARAQGAAAAAAAADKVLAAVAKKTPLDVAVKSLGLPLPPIDKVAMTREQLTQMQPRVPAPYALMFSMTKGSAKKLAAPNQAGWLVIALDNVENGTVAPNDPLIAQAAGQLGQVAGREYADELRTAITHEIGSKRNEATLRTVREALVGAQ